MQGLSESELNDLANRLGRDRFGSVFSVSVAPKDTQQDALPAMSGSFAIVDGGLRFQPKYPLTPGVRYRAVFDVSAISGSQQRLERVFELPRPPAQPATQVVAIYPSANRLPENQLKFYIHFSNPMSRGEAYDRVHFLNESGKEIEGAFLELGEELWDPTGKRFTLLFDPGRIKRGLQPRESLGPVLEAGKKYTLVIDAQWHDAAGQQLKGGERKSFAAVAADEQPIEPKLWKVDAPSAGSTASLTVTFPEPLDHALLHRLLWVIDPSGEQVAGAITVTRGETCWQFVPQHDWKSGTHRLMIDASLEDLAGNRVGEPFEVDLFKKIEPNLQRKTVEILFTVNQ